MSGNKQADKNEMSNRVREVQDYILQGQLTCDIIKQLCLKYKITERHAYRIYNKAWNGIQKENDKEKDKKKNTYVVQLKKLFRDLENKNRPSGARVGVRIIESMARMDGIIPTRENQSGFLNGNGLDDDKGVAIIKLSDGTEIEI
jgi:hypothetical protein